MRTVDLKIANLVTNCIGVVTTLVIEHWVPPVSQMHYLARLMFFYALLGCINITLDSFWLRTDVPDERIRLIKLQSNAWAYTGLLVGIIATVSLVLLDANMTPHKCVLVLLAGWFLSQVLRDVAFLLMNRSVDKRLAWLSPSTPEESR